ncbi:hypothetical protein SAMN02910358_01645 [Lachnospiraceae bacterium XBB1006]|nr:hypothetical protein SAMN02910358_01645 [Lachnospiraceae bacterium XBB1006]
MKVEKVISASVKAGSTQLHTFGGGSVKMTVKNEIKDNRNKNYFHVYYIDPLGQLIRFITEHTGLDALYRTDHFSDYVIVYDESDMNENISPITGGVVKGLTYNKKTQTVELESVKADAVDGARALVPAEAYTISGKTKVKNAGTYTLTITAKEGSGYRGSAEVTYEVEKADQQMTVKAKKVKVAAGTTKLSAKKAFTVKKAVGKVTYKKLSGSKKLSVSKSGELKIKKGSKAGKYILTLRVKAKGNKNYKAKSTKVKLTVIVK